MSVLDAKERSFLIRNTVILTIEVLLETMLHGPKLLNTELIDCFIFLDEVGQRGT